MEPVLSRLIAFNDLAVIGVRKQADADAYFLLSVTRRKNQLVVTGIKTADSMEALRAQVTRPVILVIEGKGILNKKLDMENASDREWLRTITPDSFHHTMYIQDSVRFISFGRKEAIEETLALFRAKNFEVLDFYVGSLQAALLQQTLNAGEMDTNGTTLQFAGGKLQEVSRNTAPQAREYSIGDTVLSGSCLPLYGAAIHYFLKVKSISKSHSTGLDASEIRYKKAFHFFGAAMLAGFFLLLLCSYFSIGYFSSRNMELQQANVFAAQSYQQIVALETEKKQKMDILAETGLLSGKFISAYSYEITQALPQSLRLDELNLFPLTSELKPSKKATLEAGIIVIKGEAGSEVDLSNWIGQLKKTGWIRKLEIVSIRKDRKNHSQFELKLTVQ